MIAEIVEFLVRGTATAFLVVAVTQLVQYLGARAGGVVVGLPVVIGPGMFVLLLQQGPDYVQAAAVIALFAAASSNLLAWTFARMAPRRGAWTSLGVGVLAWFLSLALLRGLPETLGFGLLAFAVVSITTQWLGHDPISEAVDSPAARRPMDLVARGLAAGVLVGTVGLLAPHADPSIAGMLVAFPIALCVVGLTIHQRHGGPAAARTLATAQISMTSIAAFSATLVVLMPLLPSQPAFWLAVAAALVPPALLAIARPVLGGRGRPPGSRK